MSTFYREFSNIEQLLQGPTVAALLDKIPHLIRGANGDIITGEKSRDLDSEFDFEFSKVEMIKVKVGQQDLELITGILKSLSYRYNKKSHLLNDYETKRSINAFINRLSLSAQGINEFDGLVKLMYQAMVKLKGIIPTKRLSIFELVDNSKLHGLIGVGPSVTYVFKDKENTLSLDTIGGFVARSGIKYVLNDVTSDIFFKDLKQNSPQNLACFPLNLGDKVLGILNMTDHVGGAFSKEDMSLINTFTEILTFLLARYQQLQYRQSHGESADILSQYVSENLINSINSFSGDQAVSSSKKVDHGIKKDIVCLFCDIRSFTTISEKLEPSTLVELLNIYFDELTGAILECKGTIDKFVGDMVAVLWNAPDDVPDAEYWAIKAAIKMQQNMVQNVVPHWTRAGVERVGVGIGLARGPAIVGNIGSMNFLNYTAIGPVLEYGEHLESNARPGELLLPEKMFKMVEGRVQMPTRIIKNHQFKGFKDNICVIKPIDYPDY